MKRSKSPKNVVSQSFSPTRDSVDLAESLSGKLLGDGPGCGPITVKEDNLGAAVDAPQRGNLQGRDGVLEAASIPEVSAESLREGQSGWRKEHQRGCENRGFHTVL